MGHPVGGGENWKPTGATDPGDPPCLIQTKSPNLSETPDLRESTTEIINIFEERNGIPSPRVTFY